MSTHSHSQSDCPNCGIHLPMPSADPSSDAAEAQYRIHDLEAQVKLLNSKAAAAVDKLADYEDEIRFLRAQSQRQLNGGFASPPPEDQRPSTSHGTTQQSQSRIASISNLWTSRKTSPNLTALPPVPPTPSNQLPLPSPGLLHNAPTSNLSQQAELALTAELEAERLRRQRAESDLSQTQNELEDLTAKLFGEANEMVAAERRARAKLEERVRLLEKRDGDKRKRLERLEGAMQRIERVRGLVGS